MINSIGGMRTNLVLPQRGNKERKARPRGGYEQQMRRQGGGLMKKMNSVKSNLKGQALQGRRVYYHAGRRRKEPSQRKKSVVAVFKTGSSFGPD